MQKTGLARRVAYRILLLFPPSFAGITLAFMLIGFVLTLGVPSMTVRTAVMVPIALALVQAIKLPLPSRGAALILLGAFEMAVLPGCAVLTGSLWGPFISGHCSLPRAFQSRGSSMLAYLPFRPRPLVWIAHGRQPRRHASRSNLQHEQRRCR